MSSSSERGVDDDFVEDEDAVSVEMGEAPAVAKKARQKRYTLQEKCGYIRIVDRLMTTHNMSRVEACQDVNIPSGMHWKWVRDLPLLIRKKNNIKAKSVHPGTPFILTPHKQEMLSFISENCEQDMAVSVQMVVVKAAQISEAFRLKTICTQYHAARRFIHAQGLVF